MTKKILIVEDQFIEANHLRIMLQRADYTVCSVARSVEQAEEIIAAEKPDLVLTGEAREWETCERVRDGMLMGLNTKLIALGHDISEEAGMAYAATWLAPKLAGVTVSHIPSGTPFKYV